MLRVESESNAPNAISGVTSHLLHVRVAGALQSIVAGASRVADQIVQVIWREQPFSSSLKRQTPSRMGMK